MKRIMRAGRLVAERPSARRGQSLVEFALILPIMLLIVLGTLEFGFVFDHHLTLEYATREGARTGAALAAGTSSVPCGDVDAAVIAAVERVLTSNGSRVKDNLNRIGEIRIYRADSKGDQVGSQANRWTYAAGGGPLIGGKKLDFKQVSSGWSACGRSNGANPDSIGVSLTYSYQLQTPLRTLMAWATIGMSDRTVMQLNPTND